MSEHRDRRSPDAWGAVARLLGLAVVAIVALAPGTADAQFAVTTTTRPGPVRQGGESDAFIWRLFAQQVVAPVSAGQRSPVQFETWASDGDVFSKTPHFPTGDEAPDFHGSTLGAARLGTIPPLGSAIDVPCKAPQNPFVGAFPTAGSPTPCIAEEVKRNRPQYDYIVNNKLNTQAGLASAFARALTVDMPATAISVKTDWVPVATLMQWIPQLSSVAEVKRLYYTTTSKAVEYALVSMHVVSKRNPAWVWGTFEHSLTPGRCDFTGCLDTFGAVDRSEPPNDRAFAKPYRACRKTPEVEALMARAGLSPVWENYCLKGTMVTFTSPNGTPLALANSVTEGMAPNVSPAAGSCISCHAYAAFGDNGKPTAGALDMLTFNPTGLTIPAALADGRGYDFMWGFLLAP